MDGWQFRIEQKRDPALAHIPVLALSADPTPKAAAIDADAYLSKPVEAETLLAAIERMILQVERRELQEHLAQSDRMTTLGTLTAGIAHEINNPLAFVLLNVDFVDDAVSALLSDEHDAPARVRLLHRAREDLHRVRAGGERIRDIVRGLKTFSRPESDKREPLDLRALVDASLGIVQNEIRYRARLVRSYDEQLPLVVGNEARLGQLFLNLLINAVQALAPGDPSRDEIRVVVQARGERVMVEVHDTGTGIPPEIRGRIFEPFFTTKPVGTGTGLGLSICHGIVTAHGGSIAVASEPGRGSCFRVELPVNGAARRSSGSGLRPAVGSSRSRVLVVDDEPAMCASFRRILEDEHDVVTLGDAREALTRITSGERFSWVVCDLMMTDMDGEQLYRAVQGIAPALAARFVFITGGAFTERTRRFLAEVPNAHIDKPFDADALRALLRPQSVPAQARHG
jgi:signal transduction histidine kinase